MLRTQIRKGRKFSSQVIMQLTPKCVTYVLLFLFIIFNVVVASPSAEKSKKPRRHAPVRPWMVFVLGTVTACFGYGVLYMFQNEKKRRKQFDSFMKNAQKEFAKLNTVPSSVVQAHERLRVELFVRLFSGSERYASLETADEAVQADGSFSESWQRKLPPEAKQEFKAALLRRTIATLPFYETAMKDYNAKSVLFQRRLINDDHWAAVQACYEDLCYQVNKIIFDANCIEEGWGSRPDGLFKTAAIIMQHEASKKQEEKMKREAARQAEKQKLKEQKVKAQQERQEQERVERQKRLANSVCEEFLRLDPKKKQ